MSKIEAQRAMWRQRYERQQAAAAARPASAVARPPVAPAVTPPEPATATVATPEPRASEPAEELCGHRNMGGRTCTRERGHTAKSHRYS